MEAELPDAPHLNQAEIANPQLFAPLVEYFEHQLYLVHIIAKAEDAAAGPRLGHYEGCGTKVFRPRSVNHESAGPRKAPSACPRAERARGQKRAGDFSPARTPRRFGCSYFRRRRNGTPTKPRPSSIRLAGSGVATLVPFKSFDTPVIRVLPVESLKITVWT